MKKFNKKEAEKYILNLLKKHNIKVVAWSKTSCGKAWYKAREIKIPKPTNIDRFCVVLHEIGHIVNYQRYGNMRKYEEEYFAEKFALQYCLKAGYNFESYIQRARNYVLVMLAKANNRGADLNKVPTEVKDFVQVDLTNWEGNKVFVEGLGRNQLPKITLTENKSLKRGNDAGISTELIGENKNKDKSVQKKKSKKT